MTTALAPTEVRSIATVHELGVDDLIAQVTKLQRVMDAVMKPGEHYGVIPGTGTKPTLLKPGAEKLCLVFRLDPQYEVTQTMPEGGHLTVVSRCTLYHIPTGNRMGSGMGSCSTKESKYAYRLAKRACPKCGAETIHRSKFPPKDQPGAEPGWYCYAKAGGCGAQFVATDSAITDQVTGRVANPELADQYNTILKMANKRSLVAAVLNVTAASDIFTQDIEDTAPPPPPPSAEPLPPVPPSLSSEGVIPIEGDEVAAASGTAPIEEWITAIREAGSPRALEQIWKGCTTKAIWPTWSAAEQAWLTTAKDTAKARLGIA